MRLVPVFTLETNNECLPKFVQMHNASFSIKPRLHEQFLCGKCIWQFLFARVDDRQIFVFKLRQAMLDGQNLGTLGTGFYRCR